MEYGMGGKNKDHRTVDPEEGLRPTGSCSICVNCSFSCDKQLKK